MNLFVIAIVLILAVDGKAIWKQSHMTDCRTQNCKIIQPVIPQPEQDEDDREGDNEVGEHE